MNFDYSPKVEALRERLVAFMAARVYPNERRFRDEVEANRAKGNPWIPTQLVEELKVEARAAGLWNLFLPQSARGAGLTNLEYAPLCELMGRVTWAPEVFNCSAPDTGNMRNTARALSLAVDREVGSVLAVGQTLAACPDIDVRDFKSFYHLSAMIRPSTRFRQHRRRTEGTPDVGE